VRILAHALVGVHAHRIAARASQNAATRRHPEFQQIARQTFAEANLMVSVIQR